VSQILAKSVLWSEILSHFSADPAEPTIERSHVMKSFLFLVIISLGLPFLMNAQTARMAEEDNRAYFTKQFYNPGVVQSIKVTTAAGRDLASIEIPENVLVSIYSSDKDQVPPFGTGFHGRISIRIKPDVKNPSRVGGVELMADAPFRIDMAEATVLVTARTKK
jgi:hypothetical protein